MKSLNSQIVNRQIAGEIVKEMKSQNHNVQKLKNLIKDAQKDGFDFNTKTSSGKTLLHHAAINDACGIVSILIKYGVNPNLCDEHYNTPLHIAVNLNRYQVVKELIKNDIDLNALGEFEQTPLHSAVINGNIDIVKLLVEAGADIMQVDEKNLSSIDYALDEKNEEIYNFLKTTNKKIKENEMKKEN